MSYTVLYMNNSDMPTYAATARFYISRARAARLRGEAALSRGFLDTAQLHRRFLMDARR